MKEEPSVPCNWSRGLGKDSIMELALRLERPLEPEPEPEPEPERGLVRDELLRLDNKDCKTAAQVCTGRASNRGLGT